MSEPFQLEVSNVSHIERSAPVIGTSLLYDQDKQNSTQHTSPKKSVSWLNDTQMNSQDVKATPVLGASMVTKET